jgi:NitT/TauT family transport system substrate-binding protein
MLASWRRSLAPSILASLLLAVLCSAAGAQEQRVRVQLLWYHQAQFAGFYVAEALGLYEAKGLEVELIEGGTGQDPLQSLASGAADVAVSWLPGAIAARRHGLAVVNVAQIFARPGTMILCRHDAGVRVTEDIRGKTIGVWNVGDQIDLRYWLARRGIALDQVTLVEQRPNGADLIEGKVACAMAMSYNEYWHVLQGGLTPTELYIVRLSEFGAGFLEDGFYVLEASLDDPARRKALADFLAVTAEGWRYARENPSEALTFTLLRDPELDPTHQREMLEAVLRLLGPGGELGLLDLTAFDRSVAVIADGSSEPDAVKNAARASWTHRLWYASGLGQAGFFKPTLATRHYLYLAVSSTWFYALSLLGTAAFALSGFMRAQQQNYNLWGAFMLAMMPALGGGTLRDLLIGGERHPPFIFQDAAYISTVLAMVAIGALFARFSPSHSIETPQFLRAKTLFDLIGMATYAAIGAEVAILAGLAWIWAPFCAALTCAGGGMLMDVITGREPRTFKGVPYEEIAVAGGFVLLAGLTIADAHEHESWLVGASLLTAMVFVFCVRLYCVQRGIMSWRLGTANSADHPRP